ncbi:MAG: hypothetical protein M3Y27_30895 [Acidobacteriota bacterium]|nr:hypothetical protein [Acidobacteriota bacterium]
MAAVAIWMLFTVLRSAPAENQPAIGNTLVIPHWSKSNAAIGVTLSRSSLSPNWIEAIDLAQLSVLSGVQ